MNLQTDKLTFARVSNNNNIPETNLIDILEDQIKVRTRQIIIKFHIELVSNLIRQKNSATSYYWNDKNKL